MNDIILSISNRFFCRKFKEGCISVIIQYREQLDSILKIHPNLVKIEEHNLINGSIQIDFEVQ